jgi:hypothetical protein
MVTPIAMSRFALLQYFGGGDLDHHPSEGADIADTEHRRRTARKSRTRTISGDIPGRLASPGRAICRPL